MTGAKYLALERGLLDTESRDAAGQVAVEPEPPPEPLTAPFCEIAAVHDGQPLSAWLRMFYRRYVKTFD